MCVCVCVNLFLCAFMRASVKKREIVDVGVRGKKDRLACENVYILACVCVCIMLEV